MKKLLAVLLATMMLMGIGAVGAGAVSYDDLTLAQKTEIRRIRAEVWLELFDLKEYRELFDTLVLRYIDDLERNHGLYLTPYYLIYDESAEAAFLAGTFETYFRDFLHGELRVYRELAVPYLEARYTAEGIEAIKPAMIAAMIVDPRLGFMEWCGKLPEGIDAKQLFSKISIEARSRFGENSGFGENFDELVNEAKWAELKTIGEEWLEFTIAFLIEHGLLDLCSDCDKYPCVCTTAQPCTVCSKEPCVCPTEQPCLDCGKLPCKCAPIVVVPEPSFFARVWNFILKWFFFGFIWNR